MKVLNTFKDKYDLLSCNEIISIYKISSIVKFKIKLKLINLFN